MNATRHIRIGLALLALALACLLALAFQLSGAWRAVAFADDVPDDVSDNPREALVEEAKQLIAALPADPDTVTEADRPAIEAATAAYDALTAEEQALLDNTQFSKDSSYGRWLEVAQWGLLAQQPIDSSLGVVDGDYSAYVKSVSNMGKSKSQRARTWSVVKLTVTGGKATALVRCGSESAFVKMRVGGVDYGANVVGGVPEFTVPIAVNGTTTFTVDANAISDSVPYQIQVTLPLEQAAVTAVAAAASKAASALGGDWSAYEDASVSAISSAANALAQASTKQGVTTVELNVTGAALDSAIAGAVKKPVQQAQTQTQTGGTKKSSTKKKKKTLTSATSKTSGTGQSQAVPTVSTNATAGSGTGGTTAAAGAASAGDDDDDDDSGDSGGSAASTTGDDEGEAIAAGTAIVQQGSTATGAAAASPSVTVREITPSASQEDNTLSLVLVGGGVVALVFAGMAARTLLFARAKDVA